MKYRDFPVKSLLTFCRDQTGRLDHSPPLNRADINGLQPAVSALTLRRSLLTTPSRLRALAVVLGVTLLGTAMAATPASAKPSPTLHAGPTGHCVVALAHGSPTPDATTCFATFTEAISSATHGRVTDAPASPATATNDLGFRERIAAANQAAASEPIAQAVILSIEYEGAPPPGAWSLTFTAANQCSASFADTDYQYSLPQAYWDQISSFVTSYCYVDHYYWQNYGLPRTGYHFCVPAGAWCTVPDMNIGGGPFPGNNNTRSLRWT